jgi:hypothetical protein
VVLAVPEKALVGISSNVVGFNIEVSCLHCILTKIVLDIRKPLGAE